MGGRLMLRHIKNNRWRKVAQGGAKTGQKAGLRHLRHHPAPLRGVAVVVAHGGAGQPASLWGGAKSVERMRLRGAQNEGMSMTKKRNRKAKPSAVTLPVTGWDIGAAGPANQIGLREEAATDIDPETGRETPNQNGIRRRRRDSWVERYFAANKLTQAQASAAIRLSMAAEGMRERE